MTIEPVAHPSAAVADPGLSPQARAAVAAGTPDETRRAYRRAIEQFDRWCTDSGRWSLPATGATLTDYATYLAYERGLAPGTIESARWAILKWHALAEEIPPATDGLVAVLKGYRGHLAETSSPKAAPRKATAASRDTMAAMLATCDRSTPAGMRDAAILLTGFGIGGRRGEIASLNIQAMHIQAEGMQVDVYRRKVRRLTHPVIHRRADTALCPVRATEAWTEFLARRGRTSGPLFIRVDQHGHLAPPLTRHGSVIGDPGGRITGRAVADVIRRHALAAELGGNWSGHSLRRGLADSMHRANRPRREIEDQGGWTADSTAVTGYIDAADQWLHDVLEGVL